MLRYIIGGVALGAIGYGLKKYFDNSETYAPCNEYKPHEHNEIDMSDLVVSDDIFLEENKLDRSRKFNETINRLFHSLKSLQEKLSSVQIAKILINYFTFL
jgi:hypothetical protein